MTPAEKLAASKLSRRSRKPGARVPQPRIWHCELRMTRLALRLSLWEVAGAVGLSVSGLWQIEMGTDPMLTTARRLAEFFGKTIEDLWPKLKEEPHA